jgi:hypothetical protein
MFVCVCEPACAREREHAHAHTDMIDVVSMCARVSVCVGVCVCVRVRARAGERESACMHTCARARTDVIDVVGLESFQNNRKPNQKCEENETPRPTWVLPSCFGKRAEEDCCRTNLLTGLVLDWTSTGLD